ncbi:site-2 protease family protein [Actinotalea solisilvae]|uniref:site-2 protease family protein n=1 Tax=Actinotalea solisilvae TaxID=2072922 RepID=UPI0018F1F761|nr:site-2 protease family protein [Actinotalea solisilvae]
MDPADRTPATSPRPGGPARPLGRVAGAPLVVSPWAGATLVVVVLVVLRLLAGQVLAPLGALLLAASLVGVAVVGSVLAHEIAHAVVARRAGVAVERVTITAWGARVALDERALRPGTTALVALAGPAVSLVLGGLAWAAAAAAAPGGIARWSLLAVAVVNGATGAMNLLPAAPLDGGKVLAAAVWGATGDRVRGTVASAWGGRVLAVLVPLVLVVRPLLAGARPDLVVVVWAAIGAAFLWTAAGASLRAGRSARRVAALDLRRLAVPAVGVPADDALADLDALGDDVDVVLLDAGWEPVAVVDRAAAGRVPASLRATTPLGAVARALPAGCVVDARLAGADALRAVAEGAAASPVLVLVEDGAVLGLLHARDVVAALRPDAPTGPAGPPPPGA